MVDGSDLLTVIEEREHKRERVYIRHVIFVTNFCEARNSRSLLAMIIESLRKTKVSEFCANGIIDERRKVSILGDQKLYRRTRRDTIFHPNRISNQTTADRLP